MSNVLEIATPKLILRRLCEELATAACDVDNYLVDRVADDKEDIEYDKEDGGAIH